MATGNSWNSPHCSSLSSHSFAYDRLYGAGHANGKVSGELLHRGPRKAWQFVVEIDQHGNRDAGAVQAEDHRLGEEDQEELVVGQVNALSCNGGTESAGRKEG